MKIEKQTTLEQNERKTEKSINIHTSSSFTTVSYKTKACKETKKLIQI